MRTVIGGVTVLLCVGAAFAQHNSTDIMQAQHDREDQQWAHKSGLTVSEVRAIRIFAGITDSSNNYVIRNIDAESLKARHHILLVEGACTRVHVLEPSGDSFREVWTLNAVPDRIWGVTENPKSPGICQKGQSADAHGTPDGRIVLEVRVRNDPFQRSIPVDTYTFQWNGSQYELINREQ